VAIDSRGLLTTEVVMKQWYNVPLVCFVFRIVRRHGLINLRKSASKYARQITRKINWHFPHYTF